MNIMELVCTRISHDLIGNIGALGNAVELLEDGDDDFMPEIKAMLSLSSAVLNGRLKFFRMAFGRTNANLENADTVSKICSDYIKTLNPHYPITLSLSPIDGQSSLNRALMLTVMVTADIIIKGGNITIKTDSKQIAAQVDSPAPLAQTKIDDIKNLLENGKFPPPESLPQYAPIFVLREMGASLKVDTNNGFTMLIG